MATTNTTIDALIATGFIKTSTNKNDGTTYKLTGDVTITFNVIYTLLKYDVFDGNNHTITYSYTGTDDDGAPITQGGIGLFKVDESIKKMKRSVCVKDLTVKTSLIANDNGNPNANAKGYGGIIYRNQQYFKLYRCNVILNDPTYGYIGSDSGGICGGRCSNFIIDSCNVQARQVWPYCGGIVGQYAGFADDSTSIITNCKFTLSTPNLTASGFGGIVGGHSANGKNSKLEISFCESSTSSILTSSIGNSCTGGGIIGDYVACGENSEVTISNCKSSWHIFGNDNNSYGGICGQFVGLGHKSKTIIKHCSTSGDIYQFAGGIVGKCVGSGGYITPTPTSDDFTPVADYVPKIRIYKCKSTGNIIGGGGITGTYTSCGSSKVLIRKCATYGNINNINNIGGGGITGPYTLTNYTTIPIKNCSIRIHKCKVYGNISIKCGGICGQYTGSENFSTFPSGINAILRIYKCKQNSLNIVNDAGCILGAESGSNDTNGYVGGNIYVYSCKYKKNAFTSDTIPYNINPNKK